MNKKWLVIKNKNTLRTWTKYFETDKDMDKFLHKIKFVKDLILIEDSRDIVYI